MPGRRHEKRGGLVGSGCVAEDEVVAGFKKSEEEVDELLYHTKRGGDVGAVEGESKCGSSGR